MPRSKCYCKSCNQPFLWMTTEAGKMMPVDYKPELENVEKWDKSMGSHWATCPGAAQFKKKREPKSAVDTLKGILNEGNKI